MVWTINVQETEIILITIQAIHKPCSCLIILSGNKSFITCQMFSFSFSVPKIYDIQKDELHSWKLKLWLSEDWELNNFYKHKNQSNLISQTYNRF